MGKEQCLNLPIKSEDDLTRLKEVSEQQFALLILRHNPGLKITYEPVLLTHINGQNGKQEGHIPDFLIVNPVNNKRIFVEITCAEKTAGIDPKEKERRVIGEVMPEERYVVLYLSNLRTIEKAHPGYDFFNGKKIKEEE